MGANNGRSCGRSLQWTRILRWILQKQKYRFQKLGLKFYNELQKTGFLHRPNTKGSPCVVMLLEVRLFYLLDEISFSVDTAQSPQHVATTQSVMQQQRLYTLPQTELQKCD